MELTFVLTIITLIILFLFFNKKQQDVKDKKEEVNKTLFNILSIAFLTIFFIYGYKKGVKYGSTIALFIWAFLVCSVPIPQVALLLAFPLKNFFNINMSLSQMIISLFAFFILLFYYFTCKSIIKTTKIGKIFLNIMKNKVYSIFIISILASIVGTHLLDIFVDLFVFKTKKKDNKIYRDSLFFSVMFIVLNLWYFKIAFKNNIFI